MEWLLVVICGLLWAIYSVLNKCLSEIKQVSTRIEVTNGLLVSVVDHADALSGNVGDIDRKVGSIEDATSAFHNQMIKAQSRY